MGCARPIYSLLMLAMSCCRSSRTQPSLASAPDGPRTDRPHPPHDASSLALPRGSDWEGVARQKVNISCLIHHPTATGTHADHYHNKAKGRTERNYTRTRRGRLLPETHGHPAAQGTRHGMFVMEGWGERGGQLFARRVICPKENGLAHVAAPSLTVVRPRSYHCTVP